MAGVLVASKLVGYLPSLIFAEEGNNVWLNLFVDATHKREDCTLIFKDGVLTVRTDVMSADMWQGDLYRPYAEY